MSRRTGTSSQQLWMEAEALERAGKGAEAIGVFVEAAVAEEDSGEPLRARFLWEEIARRTGPTGTLLERLALCSGKARLVDDAHAYWTAAAQVYVKEGREADASRARVRAAGVAGRRTGGEPPPLAAAILAAQG